MGGVFNPRGDGEGFAAQLAAEHIDDQRLSELNETWRGFDLASAPDENWGRDWAAANQRFHSLIVEASGNRQIGISLEAIHHRLPPNTGYAAYLHNTRLARKNLAEHQAITSVTTAPMVRSWSAMISRPMSDLGSSTRTPSSGPCAASAVTTASARYSSGTRSATTL